MKRKLECWSPGTNKPELVWRGECSEPMAPEVVRLFKPRLPGTAPKDVIFMRAATQPDPSRRMLYFEARVFEGLLEP